MKIKVGQEYVSDSDSGDRVELPEKAHIDHIEFEEGAFRIIYYQMFNESGELI
jgi:hypothetical protein